METRLTCLGQHGALDRSRRMVSFLRMSGFNAARTRSGRSAAGKMASHNFLFCYVRNNWTATSNVNLELATDAQNNCCYVVTCTRSQIRLVFGHPVEDGRIFVLSREKNFRSV